MRKILVVEDNQDMAKTLSMLLRHQGFDTQQVGEGALAIRAATEYQPDIILLDLSLPNRDGYEVAKQVRAQAAFAEVPIHLLSGYPPNRAKMAAAGITSHLLKPVKMHALFELIGRDPPPSTRA